MARLLGVSVTAAQKLTSGGQVLDIAWMLMVCDAIGMSPSEALAPAMGVREKAPGFRYDATAADPMEAEVLARFRALEPSSRPEGLARASELWDTMQGFVAPPQAFL